MDNFKIALILRNFLPGSLHPQGSALTCRGPHRKAGLQRKTITHIGKMLFHTNPCWLNIVESVHLWFCGVRWASAILWTCTERRKLPPAKQKIEFKFSLQQWQNHDGTSIVRSLTMTQNQWEVFWRCIKDDDHVKQPYHRALGRDQWVCGWHTRAHPSAPETSLLLLIFIRDVSPRVAGEDHIPKPEYIMTEQL